MSIALASDKSVSGFNNVKYGSGNQTTAGDFLEVRLAGTDQVGTITYSYAVHTLGGMVIIDLVGTVVVAASNASTVTQINVTIPSKKSDFTDSTPLIFTSQNIVGPITKVNASKTVRNTPTTALALGSTTPFVESFAYVDI